MSSPELIITDALTETDVVLIDERKSFDISVILSKKQKHAVVVSRSYYDRCKAACPEADNESIALALEAYIVKQQAAALAGKDCT
jgi:hypothetical protein